MPISIVCPSCKTKLKVKDELEGKSIKCPKCDAGVEVVMPQMEPEEIADDTVPAPEKEAAAEPKPTKEKGKKQADKKAAAEDDDSTDEEKTGEDEEKPRKKKKKKKKKPLPSLPILIGIGTLVVGSIAALVYFVFLKGDSPSGVQAKAKVIPAPGGADKMDGSAEKEKDDKKTAPEKKEEKKAEPKTPAKKEEKKEPVKKDEKTDPGKKEGGKKEEKKEPAKVPKNLKAIWDKIAHAQPIAELEKILGEKGKTSSNPELAKVVYGKETFADRNPLTRLAALVPNPVFHCWYVGNNALVVVSSKKHATVHRAVYLERRPEGVMRHMLDESSPRKSELDKY